MATKRLIDANALLKVLRHRVKGNEDSPFVIGTNNTLDIFADFVWSIPTVDAVEVVHGRWKYYHKQNITVCTNCSFERDLDANFGKAVSCPNCGADMRERKNDD